MRPPYTNRWFERRFDFPVPVELLPNICVRLRGTPARLEELVGETAPEALVARKDGGWSAQENAGHLADLEPLWMARLEDFRSNHTKLTVADLQNRKTHESDHNSRSLSDILKSFRQLRTQFLTTIDQLQDEELARELPHPRLHVPMRVADHLYFVAEHDDHHLARIWDLIHHTP